MPQKHRLKTKLVDLELLLGRLAAERHAGRRIVFTNGCFDLLHVGHVRYLNTAREFGDLLVVGLNDDASVRRLKGPNRPVYPIDERVEILSALEAVDLVVVFATDSVAPLVEKIRPDVLVKGGDYAGIEEVVGWEIVKSYGGEVHVVGHVPGRSSSEILKELDNDCDGDDPQ
jgi:D-beta-D-heptose 7-phosphate kinase/D-beta-D-heptose 1-phosphate adenosyltransferase